MKFKNNSNNYDKYFVYGINGVESILNSNKCQVSQIIVSDTFNQGKMSDGGLIIKKFKNKVIILNKNEFQNKYQEYRTQGIIVFFDYEVFSHLPKSINEKKNECHIILDSIKDPQNLGQIIRTSECAGIDGIIVPERRSVSITSSVFQVSQGSFCNINIVKSKNIKYTIKELKQNGYWIVGIENSIESKLWYDYDLKGKIGFVFGSEGEGIRPVIKKYCDLMLTIPVNGKINSLNISATVSAMLFERNRQILKSK